MFIKYIWPNFWTKTIQTDESYLTICLVPAKFVRRGGIGLLQVGIIEAMPLAIVL